MKKKKVIKVSLSVSLFIMLIQLVVLVFFHITIDYNVNKNIRNNTVNSMKTIVMERSTIIENCVTTAEAYLTAYSRSSDVRNLLANPQNADAQRAAQDYTERFSADRSDLEGIYASEWDTHVLAHTNAAVVGITTRTGDSLEALRNSMLATDGVYTPGIIISPASGQQIISMYKSVLDEEGNPIGLVGGGIFTTGLKETLNALPITGLENAKYYLINATTGEYIFHEDEEFIGTAVEEEDILSVLSSVDKETVGFLQNEVGDITAYCYMPDRGWVFVLADTAEEIFASANTVKVILLALCVVAELVLTVATYVIVSNMMKPLTPVGKLLMKMADCNLTEEEKIGKYINKRSDLGQIAAASLTLVQSQREIIGTLTNCSEQVDGKAAALHSHAMNLVDSVNENIATTEELSASMETVNGAAEEIKDRLLVMQDAIRATASSIATSNASSAEMISSAQQMKRTANSALEHSKEKMNSVEESVNQAIESLNSLRKINDMAKDIINITDQTKLLSLNASIEAARAGEAGRGFAVVADEIKSLANTSANTAGQIQELCEASDKSVEAVRGCIEDIMKYMAGDVLQCFEQFANRSNEYAASVNVIREDIEAVNRFVTQLTSATEMISQNITSITYSTRENAEAVTDIVRKNESTAEIAEGTQALSEENKQVAEKLEEIVKKFKL